MAALRCDFEEVADVGVYTHDRRADLAWGFYPYPRGVRRDRAHPIVSYARLTDMPVLRARDFLADLCALPENLQSEEMEVAPAEGEDQGHGEPHGQDPPH